MLVGCPIDLPSAADDTLIAIRTWIARDGADLLLGARPGILITGPGIQTDQVVDLILGRLSSRSILPVRYDAATEDAARLRDIAGPGAAPGSDAAVSRLLVVRNADRLSPPLLETLEPIAAAATAGSGWRVLLVAESDPRPAIRAARHPALVACTQSHLTLPGEPPRAAPPATSREPAPSTATPPVAAAPVGMPDPAPARPARPDVADPPDATAPPRPSWAALPVPPPATPVAPDPAAPPVTVGRSAPPQAPALAVPPTDVPAVADPSAAILPDPVAAAGPPALPGPPSAQPVPPEPAAPPGPWTAPSQAAPPKDVPAAAKPPAAILPVPTLLHPPIAEPVPTERSPGRDAPVAQDPVARTLPRPAVVPLALDRLAPPSAAAHADRLDPTESDLAPARRSPVRLTLLILVAGAVFAALALVVVLGLVTSGPTPSDQSDQPIVPPIEPVHPVQPTPRPQPKPQPQPVPQPTPQPAPTPEPAPAPHPAPAPTPLPAPTPPPAPLPTVVVPELPATPLRADPARPAPPAAPARRPSSLLLLAAPGDTLASLYERVYRGDQGPPSFPAVQALNPKPVRPGVRLVFPAPDAGWPGAASPVR